MLKLEIDTILGGNSWSINLLRLAFYDLWSALVRKDVPPYAKREPLSYIGVNSIVKKMVRRKSPKYKIFTEFYFKNNNNTQQLQNLKLS